MPLAHSMLLLGASGTGKSSFARSALKSLGSGSVIMAPGFDEANSYAEMLDEPRFSFRGFDDTEFAPSQGAWNADGATKAYQWMRELVKQVEGDVAGGKVPRYSVVVLDTVTSLLGLGYNAALAKFKIANPPPAISPDGSAFYGLVQQRMDELFRPVRQLKGFGVHLIALGHVTERDNKSGEALIATKEFQNAARIISPRVQGGFKDVLPGFFDVVVHTGVVKGKDGKDSHYLQYRPSSKRPTKARWGNLSATDQIVLPEEQGWQTLMGLIDAAAAKRAGNA